ncbi:DUF2846 domain-containing protein [Neisseria perflava]|uniref:DUF2846 domain-containing protein n=1 Tax=Neisseria perflava TaxID=33053 RepID=UPI00209FC3CF|nr:DUF2846 domain-containing protein [Neisseria perflava]MCP1659960.1 hypothetical protein [Neisseria perflava]MCP1773194.1 hypothetical protein [Neisseria perflava]
MKLFFSTLSAAALLAVTGCASVSHAPQEAAGQAKTFAAPAEGKAGLYVYRSNSIKGSALKKDVWVDGKCLGETARGVFFYTEVDGGKSHTIATESEFSANSLNLYTEAGKNYFVRQYIKMGVFVGGANLEQVAEAEGKAAVQTLNMAATGNCSKPNP